MYKDTQQVIKKSVVLIRAT